jgi:hypothetical protein
MESTGVLPGLNLGVFCCIYKLHCTSQLPPRQKILSTTCFHTKIIQLSFLLSICTSLRGCEDRTGFVVNTPMAWLSFYLLLGDGECTLLGVIFGGSGTPCVVKIWSDVVDMRRKYKNIKLDYVSIIDDALD